MAGLAACESWQRERPPELEPEVTVAPPAAVLPQPTGPTPLTEAERPPMTAVVEPGTGRFVQPPPVRSRASVARNAAGEVTLNVVDAELREVVRLVLGDTLGVNYVIDPAVGGTITVQTSEPVPAADLAPLLDAILRVNGAALVQIGDLYKVVPLDQALSSGLMPEIQPVADARRPGFKIQVVPVRFVAAAELAELLTPFVPPGGAVQADPERNVLLLAGTPADLGTLTDLVAMFDVDWLAGMSFGLFPLEFGRAVPVVAELEQIFALEAGPVAGVVRFAPVERLNAVLVMSAQPAYIERAAAWIERLDQAGDGEEAQVFVYPVQNGRAADLAEVLGEIFAVRAATVGPQDLLAPGLAPAALQTSLFERDEAEPEVAPERRERPPVTAPRVRQPTTGLAPAEGALEPEIRIIADATTNSLVVWAPPREYRKIRAALEQLDILPLQVLIEATIAEIGLRDELRYGVEWFFRFGDVSLNLSQRRSGAVNSVFPGFSALFAGTDVRAVLNALEAVTDVNVVSSPQLLVLDNQTARLQVGDQVPIVVQQATSVIDPEAPIVNSIELRDTGVILSVTPRVNVSGLVILELQQEVSNVVQSETETSSEQATPTISQRQISSTVAVQSGETVVLGGLIQDDQDRSVSGVPLLARLPILGPLFGTRSRVASRTELLVMITPRVIRGAGEARAVSDELRRRLRSLDPLTARVR